MKKLSTKTINSADEIIKINDLNSIDKSTLFGKILSTELRINGYYTVSEVGTEIKKLYILENK